MRFLQIFPQIKIDIFQYLHSCKALLETTPLKVCCLLPCGRSSRGLTASLSVIAAHTERAQTGHWFNQAPSCPLVSLIISQ